MIIHCSFFIFFLFTSSTLIFTEVYSSTEEINIEVCQFVIDDLLEYPHSRHTLCDIKQYCIGPSWTSESDEILIMINDYIVKQFLYKHQDVSFEERGGVFKNAQLFTSSWLIPEIKNYTGPQLQVIFDKCGYITKYSYRSGQSEGIFVNVVYPYDDRDLEDIKTFEEHKYNVIKAIMQRHPTPAIQMSEFNILLNDIHCNEGLELYIRDNNIPVCLKEHTYEKMLERGFNLTRQ